MSYPNPTYKRTRAQRDQDSLFTEQKALRKWTLRQIADALAIERSIDGKETYRISPQQVGIDLRKVRRKWQQEAIATVGQQVHEELRGLDAQERELWAAWEKSKEDAQRSLQESIKGGQDGGARSKVQLTKEGQCGEPSYQRLILEVRERRAKLLGLDAPTRQEITGAALGSQVIIYLPDNQTAMPVVTSGAAVDVNIIEDKKL